MATMAHNTERSGTKRTAPVIGDSDTIPADDRDNWHEATDAEHAAYEAYWNGKHDAEAALQSRTAPAGQRTQFRAYRVGNRRDWNRPWLIDATRPNADGNTTWGEYATVSEATQYINGARDGIDDAAA